MKMTPFLSGMMVSHLTCGAALAILWKWFVEPTGAPGINYAQAIGISLIAELLTQRGMNYGLKESPNTNPNDHRMWATVVASVFTVFLGLSLPTIVSISEGLIASS
jgi:hypothetical protein